MDFRFSLPDLTDAYLIVNSQIYPLTDGVTTIGRTLDNDLIIQQPTISRRHAEIRRVGDSFIIRDLQSTSGTYLNKYKIKECALYSGDLIVVADVPIMFINQGFKVSDDTEQHTSMLFGFNF